MIPRRSQSASIIIPRQHDLMTPAGLPSPADMGMPSRFQQWRQGQWHGISAITDTPTRFVVLCMPTGAGKSITAAAAAMLTGMRTVILTATKGLQDQYASQIGEITLDVRGMSNYLCPAAEMLGIAKSTTVSEAPCQSGYKCPLRSGYRDAGGCEYFVRYRRAQSAPIVVTNYQAWMYDALKDKQAMHHAPWERDDDDQWSRDAGSDENDTGKPGIVDLLIADEAGEAHEECSRFVGVRLSQRECLQLGLPSWPQHKGDKGDGANDVDLWAEWSRQVDRRLVGRLLEWEQKLRLGTVRWSREIKLLRDMHRKLVRLGGMQARDEWIAHFQEDSNRGNAVTFTPLEPARYAERVLWRGVKKVVLMSATVRPKTAELLGIKPDEMTFIEYPSTFDKRRRPIVVVPSVMMNYRTESDDRAMLHWLHRMDSYIALRTHWKGIIHAVSYRRADFIRNNSEFGRYMLTHHSGNRPAVIQQFREIEPPGVLVSPSVDTGYDFPAEAARWCIVAKIPFQSVNDPVIKARKLRDPDYITLQVADTLQQMTGRIVRAPEDWGESAILDDAFGNYFFRMARKFLASWWVESLVWADGVPSPLEVDDMEIPAPAIAEDIDEDICASSDNSS